MKYLAHLLAGLASFFSTQIFAAPAEITCPSFYTILSNNNFSNAWNSDRQQNGWTKQKRWTMYSQTYIDQGIDWNTVFTVPLSDDVSNANVAASMGKAAFMNWVELYAFSKTTFTNKDGSVTIVCDYSRRRYHPYVVEAVSPPITAGFPSR